MTHDVEKSLKNIVTIFHASPKPSIVKVVTDLHKLEITLNKS